VIKILSVDYARDYINNYKYKWRYTDKERSLQKYCRCYDCGMKYHVVGRNKSNRA
jgi:hypothetical protein